MFIDWHWYRSIGVFTITCNNNNSLIWSDIQEYCLVSEAVTETMKGAHSKCFAHITDTDLFFFLSLPQPLSCFLVWQWRRSLWTDPSSSSSSTNTQVTLLCFVHNTSQLSGPGKVRGVTTVFPSMFRCCSVHGSVQWASGTISRGSVWILLLIRYMMTTPDHQDSYDRTDNGNRSLYGCCLFISLNVCGWQDRKKYEGRWTN